MSLLESDKARKKTNSCIVAIEATARNIQRNEKESLRKKKELELELSSKLDLELSISKEGAAGEE